MPVLHPVPAIDALACPTLDRWNSSWTCLSGGRGGGRKGWISWFGKVLTAGDVLIGLVHTRRSGVYGGARWPLKNETQGRQGGDHKRRLHKHTNLLSVRIRILVDALFLSAGVPHIDAGPCLGHSFRHKAPSHIASGGSLRTLASFQEPDILR